MHNRMKLSVLIPTYNYDCSELVKAMQEQGRLWNEAFEIIVADDASTDASVVAALDNLGPKEEVKVLHAAQNMGRARIRNFLAEQAQGEWLLFMDADGKVIRKDFLRKYMEAAQEHEVVCGGVVHPDEWHDPERMLRWKYEKAYERKYGNISEQFRSFSFLIHHSVVQKVRFDERYRGYGYEDVQFGKDLKAAGFTIHGIDNPLLNNDIEDNATFLRKTEEALRAAHHFREDIGDLVKMNRLSTRYRVFSPLIRILYRLSAPLLRRNLLGHHPSLKLFAFYKLGYYLSLK